MDGSTLKKFRKITKGGLVLVIGLVLVSIFFSCQIKSHYYNYKTTMIFEEAVNELKCYDLVESDSNEAKVKCENLINKHNIYTEKWVSLGCIGSSRNSKNMTYEVKRVAEIEIGPEWQN